MWVGVGRSTNMFMLFGLRKSCDSGMYL